MIHANPSSICRHHQRMTRLLGWTWTLAKIAPTRPCSSLSSLSHKPMEMMISLKVVASSL